MFGRTIVPLGTPPPPRPFPKDRTGLGSQAYEYGLLERRAGSDWPSRKMQYEQRKEEIETKKKKAGSDDVFSANHRHKWEMACDRRNLFGTVKRQVDAAMRGYDEILRERREKVRVLLLNEEASLEREMMDRALSGQQERDEELKRMATEMRLKREADRKAVVEEKRLQQYKMKCEDLRPALAKRNLIETKNAQLMQMKDKECMKEEERLRDRMWYEVSMKDAQSKEAREEQDARDRFSRDRDDLKTVKLQMAATEEKRRQKKELQDMERREQAKVREELRQEEIQRLKDKIDRRDAMAQELKEQIAVREAFLAQRKKEEDAIDNTFAKLAAEELRREIASIQDNTERFKREMGMYRENLAELKKERDLEEARFDQLIKEDQKEIEDKRDENRRIMREARQKLLDDTMKGRHQQLEDKKKKAMEDANLKMLEEEVMGRLHNTHLQLAESHEREQQRLREQYRLDLLSQIEYSTELRRREQEELDREFLSGLMEQERYLRLVRELLAMPLVTTPHPFTAVMAGKPAALEGKREVKEMCPCTPSPLL